MPVLSLRSSLYLIFICCFAVTCVSHFIFSFATSLMFVNHYVVLFLRCFLFFTLETVFVPLLNFAHFPSIIPLFCLPIVPCPTTFDATSIFEAVLVCVNIFLQRFPRLLFLLQRFWLLSHYLFPFPDLVLSLLRRSSIDN